MLSCACAADVDRTLKWTVDGGCPSDSTVQIVGNSAVLDSADCSTREKRIRVYQVTTLSAVLVPNNPANAAPYATAPFDQGDTATLVPEAPPVTATWTIDRGGCISGDEVRIGLQPQSPATVIVQCETGTAQIRSSGPTTAELLIAPPPISGVRNPLRVASATSTPENGTIVFAFEREYPVSVSWSDENNCMGGPSVRVFANDATTALGTFPCAPSSGTVFVRGRPELRFELVYTAILQIPNVVVRTSITATDTAAVIFPRDSRPFTINWTTDNGCPAGAFVGVFGALAQPVPCATGTMVFDLRGEPTLTAFIIPSATATTRIDQASFAATGDAHDVAFLTPRPVVVNWDVMPACPSGSEVVCTAVTNGPVVARAACTSLSLTASVKVDATLTCSIPNALQGGAYDQQSVAADTSPVQLHFEVPRPLRVDWTVVPECPAGSSVRVEIEGFGTFVKACGQSPVNELIKGHPDVTVRLLAANTQAELAVATAEDVDDAVNVTLYPPRTVALAWTVTNGCPAGGVIRFTSGPPSNIDASAFCDATGLNVVAIGTPTITAVLSAQDAQPETDSAIALLYDAAFEFVGSPPANDEVCNDGGDNDNDSIVDCADSDCVGSTYCIQIPPTCTPSATQFATSGTPTAVDNDAVYYLASAHGRRALHEQNGAFAFVGPQDTAFADLLVGRSPVLTLQPSALVQVVASPSLLWSFADEAPWLAVSSTLGRLELAAVSPSGAYGVLASNSNDAVGIFSVPQSSEAFSQDFISVSARTYDNLRQGVYAWGGNKLYMAHGNDLEIVDITDPGALTFGTVATGVDTASESIACIATTSTHLLVVIDPIAETGAGSFLRAEVYALADGSLVTSRTLTNQLGTGSAIALRHGGACDSIPVRNRFLVSGTADNGATTRPEIWGLQMSNGTLALQTRDQPFPTVGSGGATDYVRPSRLFVTKNSNAEAPFVSYVYYGAMGDHPLQRIIYAGCVQ